MERDFFMSPDEAKDYGLIDQVHRQARADAAPAGRPLRTWRSVQTRARSPALGTYH